MSEDESHTFIQASASLETTQSFQINANGNTFSILLQQDNPNIVVETAEKNGVDGVIFLFKDNDHWRMRIYDKDGTFENMCGNGLRATAFICRELGLIKNKDFLMTDDGLKRILFNGNRIIVMIGSVKKNGPILNVAGVPHFVVNKKMNKEQDELLRKAFNANITNYWHGAGMNYRTFEVGVEDYTKSCGTGAVAVTHTLNRNALTLKSGDGYLHVVRRNGNYYLTGDVKILN